MESFYLTLISDDSLNFFPDNCPNSFINRLDETIHLSESVYEMALCEMSYIAGFKNNEHNASFQCFDFLADYRLPQNKKRKRNLSDVDDEILTKKRKRNLSIGDNIQKYGPPQKYGKMTTIHLNELSISSPSELVTILNEQVWLQVSRLKQRKKQIFSYDIVQNRIWLNFNNDEDYISLKLHSNILELVGCMKDPKPSQVIYVGRDKRKQGYMYKNRHRYFGPAYADVRWESTCRARDFFMYEPQINNVDAFLIYTNLIYPCQIGSGRANLLRFVDVPSKNKERKRISINLGGIFFYKKLCIRDISDIQIQIKDIKNQPVKFNSYVRIVVHIRPQILHKND